jgi:hypothetical protein
MSGIQKIVIAAGIMLIALSTLVPPWVYTFQTRGIQQVKIPAGYYFIFSPPQPRAIGYLHGVQIDHSRLIIQTVTIISVTFVAFYLINTSLTAGWMKRRMNPETLEKLRVRLMALSPRQRVNAAERLKELLAKKMAKKMAKK